MGTVYRARQKSLDRLVALKVLADEYAEDVSFRERFVRESRLVAATQHRNIIPIYDAGEEDGVLYLTMLYVEGPTLQALVAEEGPLEPTVPPPSSPTSARRSTRRTLARSSTATSSRAT